MAKSLKAGERYKVFFPNQLTRLRRNCEFYLFIHEDATITVEANFVATYPVAKKTGGPHSPIILSIEDIPPEGGFVI